tara:strand:+ start:10362 stop:10970 length:609 start_codon:yes stop_codon:yes gene_type:complete
MCCKIDACKTKQLNEELFEKDNIFFKIYSLERSSNEDGTNTFFLRSPYMGFSIKGKNGVIKSGRTTTGYPIDSLETDNSTVIYGIHVYIQNNSADVELPILRSIKVSPPPELRRPVFLLVFPAYCNKEDFVAASPRTAVFTKIHLSKEKIQTRLKDKIIEICTEFSILEDEFENELIPQILSSLFGEEEKTKVDAEKAIMLC